MLLRGTVAQWSVRCLNRIARITGALRYLEIGVDRGGTFLGEEFSFGTGVGLDLSRFIPDSVHVSESVELLNVSSHVFFESCRTEFDRIYLDGLRTAEQTCRDLINSSEVNSAGAVWLIDETVPTSVFSALRDYGRPAP